MKLAAITVCASLILVTGCSHGGARTSDGSVSRPTPVAEIYPPHGALVGLSYRLKSVLGCAHGKDALDAWDRRYLKRVKAVEAALEERFGKAVMQRDLIMTGTCHDSLSERELRRNFERELRAWESELNL